VRTTVENKRFSSYPISLKAKIASITQGKTMIKIILKNTSSNAESVALTVEILLEDEVFAVAITDEFPIGPGEERELDIPLSAPHGSFRLRVLVSTSASGSREFLLQRARRR
jgi:hypothetical protein